VWLILGVAALATASVDPDDKRTICEIVQAKNYDCTAINITTRDGYILTNFRVGAPAFRTAKKPVVLLWHGLLDNCFTWIVNMPNESLPYILADAGYDVWLANNRGNTYGRHHVRMTDKDEEFWQFSWDSFVQYDVPDVINYIRTQTGVPTVSYVGHSEGTIQMFASLIRRTVTAQMINIFMAFAPVTTVGHETNKLFRVLSEPGVMVAWEAVLGKKAFLPTPEQLLPFDEALCRADPFACEILIEAFCGKHNGAFNNSRMQVMAGHEPGGTSMRNMEHWAQLVHTDKYEMYDYGKKGNMAHYNQTTPPAYNLTQYPTNVPLALFTGNADELADPADVQTLLKSLPMTPVVHQNIPDYAHLDFVWCTTAVNDMYRPTVLPLLQKYAVRPA
jgi:pimeloyl-ACP methyl ester carboxylesterase